MGDQFWWFYDVAAAAVVLVCIFLSGRKGITRALTSLVGCILAFAIALTVSGSISRSIYKTTIKDSNSKKLAHALEGKDFTQDMKVYLESLGYNIKVDYKKLNEILSSGEDINNKLFVYVNSVNGKPVDDEDGFYEKLYEGEGEIISGYVTEELSKFAGATAKKNIKKNPETIDQFAPLMQIFDDPNEEFPMTKAGKFISNHYISSAYITLVRLIAFIILVFLVVLITWFVFKSFLDDDSGYQGIFSHTVGGFLGIVNGAVYVCVVAAMIRLYVVLGSNEMLFFNHSAIDKTYIFKYFYKFITSTM